MNTLAFSPARPIRTRSSRPVRTTLHALLGHVARTWSIWQAERAMARLDDNALHDMGLARSEIGRAVRDGRRPR